MDNLFAVISFNLPSNNNSLNEFKCFSNSLFNNTSSLSTKISNQDNFIYLTKYASENSNTDSDIKKEPQRLSEHLKAPIIGKIRIDNKLNINALCKPILNDGIQFSSPDEESLFNAYKKLKVKAFKKMKGNFQAIFWDEHSQQLCAVIDAFSSRSLFYIKQADSLYIGSDAKVLAKATNTNLTVNKIAISQWLAGRPNPDLSMFNELKRLPAGHCLEFSKENGIKITKFWDIDPGFSVTYNNTEDYKAHFFELLQSSVANRLNATQLSENTAVFCQMSGGMDSTSVTAIAKQLQDKENFALHTMSHQYKNTQTCDESTNIKDMISKLGLAHQHYIELDQFESRSFAQLYPTDFDNPGVVLSPKYHQELALMKHLGASVLLTGNGGDETCWGHSASYRSRLFKGEFGVINEVIDACGQLNEPIARSLYKLFMPNSIQNLVKLARNKPTNTNECPPWLTLKAFNFVKEELILSLNHSFID